MSSDYISEIKDFKDKIITLTDDSMYPLIILPKNVSIKLNDKINDDSLLGYCRQAMGDQPYLHFLNEPIRPVEPHENEIPETHVINVPISFWNSTNWHITIHWLIIAITLGALLGFSEWGLTGAFIFFVCWLPVWILLIILCGEKRKTESKEIPYTKEELEVLRNIEKERYQKEIEEYSHKIGDYTVYEDWYYEAANWREESMNDYVKSFLSQSLKSIFVESENYEVVDDPPQKGRSEDLLFASLMNCKPESVHIDTTICGKYPDLMISTKNGVYIDVEIDEPYEMESKKEIHYIGGGDEDRNALLAQKEWVVIRFSEKQIMTNCNACTNLINKMVEVIEKGDIQSLDELNSIKNSIKEKRWTKEEARMMAINNERNTYPGSKTVVNNNLSKKTNNYKEVNNNGRSKRYESTNDGLPF